MSSNDTVDNKADAINLSNFDIGPDHIIHKELKPFEYELPAKASGAPGMLSAVERKLLALLSSERYTGDGAIIDGGSFFGSSVCALAAGLRCNPRATSRVNALAQGKPIVAYELGYLPAPASEKAQRRRVYNGQEYLLGESFVPILEKAVAPYEDLVELRIGDFLEQSWPRERPIELCFVDCAKTQELNRHVCAELFPSFIPGKTYLVHQDFYFDRLPWIKVSMAYFSPYFEWLGQIETSSVYKCVAPIPVDFCRYDPYTMGSADERLRLHAQCETSYLPAKRRFMLAISHCYLQALCGQRDAALERLARVEEEFPQFIQPEGQMNVVRTERARRQISLDRIHGHYPQGESSNTARTGGARERVKPDRKKRRKKSLFERLRARW